LFAHELDARAEGVLKVCDQLTSVSALKDFIRSCLHAEAIKLVAAHGDKIGYAHGQANIFKSPSASKAVAFPSKTRSLRSTWPRDLWQKTSSPVLHQLKHT